MSILRLRAPAAAFLIVFVVRALLALTRWDELRGEEVYNSTLAVALLQGLDLRADQIPVIDHLRGSAVFGVLLVPMIAVTHAPFFCLKLLACLWSALTAALLSYALERGIGRRAAYTGAVLFALLPPSFVIMDVLALGSHGDTVLFLAGALACLAGRRAGVDLGWRRAGLLGLACGCGALFSDHGKISLLAVLVAWLCVDPRFVLRRSVLAFLVAAAVAFAPSKLLSPSTDVQGKSFSSLIFPDGVGGAFAKLWSLFAGDFRRSLLFEEHGGAWLSWLYLALVLAALPAVFARVRRRDPLAVFALAYPVIFAGAFAALNFELNLVNTTNGIGSRYLMPILPFVAWWVLLSWEELARGGRNALGLGQVAVFCAVGAISLASYLDPGAALRMPRLRGVAFAQFRDHIQHAAGPEPLVRLELLEELDPQWAAWWPLTHGVVEAPGVKGPGEFNRALRAARLGDSQLRPFLVAALGGRAAVRLPAEVWPALTQEMAEEDEDLAWFLRGIGSEFLRQASADEVVAQWMRMLRLREKEDKIEGHLESLLKTGQVRSVARWLRYQEGQGESEAVEVWLRELSQQPDRALVAGRLRTEMQRTVYDRIAALPPELGNEVAFGAGFWLGTAISPYNLMFVVVLRDAEGHTGEWVAHFYRGLGTGYRIRFDEDRFWPPEPGALRVERLLPDAARPYFQAGLRVEHD